jgi:Ca2+-binding EF-hand superfamily protein
MNINPITRTTQLIQTAIEHAECPISFEVLYQAPCGVFIDDHDRRVSQHFYNYDAAIQWLNEKNTCPITRKKIYRVKLVPDIRTDTHNWFKLVDIDGDGKLSKKEIIEALKAQLPIDYRLFENEHILNQLWTIWDKDGSGFIEETELIGETGLINYVESVFKANQTNQELPNIKLNRVAWFNYFDEDNSNSLEQPEVCRALIKTFNLTPQMTDNLIENIKAIWNIFDTDGNGSIDKDEFLLPNIGLADTIIAQLN